MAALTRSEAWVRVTTVLAVIGVLAGSLISASTTVDMSVEYVVANRLLSVLAVVAGGLLAVYLIRLVDRERAANRDLRRVESTLHADRTLLELASTMGHIGGWSVDLATEVVTWSGEVARIHGTTEGSSPRVDEGLAFYAPEDRQRIAAVFDACRLDGVPYDEELRIVRTDGGRRWVRTIGRAVRDETGAIVGIEGAFQDITDRREAAESLAESERRFRELAEAMAAAAEESRRLASDLTTTLESIGDALLMLDRDWRVAYLNGHAERLLRVSRADAMGRVIWDLFPEAIGSTFQVEYERAVTTGATGTFQEFYPPLDAWFDVSAYPNPDGLAIYFRDVTEKHARDAALFEAEERFRLLSRATSDAIWDWDVKNDHVWRSDGFQVLFGLRIDQVEPTSGSWRERVHPDDRERVVTSIRSAIDGGAADWDAEYRFERAGSGYARVQDRATIIRDGDGGAVRIVGAMTDVSTQRALESQLQQAQRLEAIGQLTGGVAHDFNNLLTVILGYSELLAEELRDDRDRRELAETAIRAARRGAELTQQLLAFARQTPLAPRSVDINALVTGMTGLLQRTLGEEIEVDIVQDPSVWAALVDPAQLENALLNLAINARDAMKPAGGRLTIETDNVVLDTEYAEIAPDVAPGRYVRIAVTDTGVGISGDVIDRVFDPFFTTKETGKGTGLGLSMVFGFIKQTGGHIRIYSERGEGTTIRMYLPTTGDLATLDDAVPPYDEAIPGGRETVLLVEDDDLVRRYAQDQLTAFGYVVVPAADGPSALRVLTERDDIDLLFTDIVMPGGMNGRELAEAVRASGRLLPVLFTSGYAQDAIVHHGRLDPGVQLLGKPYSRAALARAIRSALDGGPGTSPTPRGPSI